MAQNLYASDGRCHNSNRGTYGHECGKPAEWLGTKRSGFTSGFCARCKVSGDEAREYGQWVKVAPARDDFDAFLIKCREKQAARDAEADRLAGAGKPVRFAQDKYGLSYLASLDTHATGLGYRLTSFRDGVPQGHLEFRTLRAAILEGLRSSVALECRQ